MYNLKKYNTGYYKESIIRPLDFKQNILSKILLSDEIDCDMYNDIYYGVHNPNNNIGSYGDVYLNTLNSNIYIKNNDNWKLLNKNAIQLIIF